MNLWTVSAVGLAIPISMLYLFCSLKQEAAGRPLVFSTHYTFQDGNVYFDGDLIKSADANTFIPLPFPNSQEESGYAKDRSNVYYRTSVLPYAAPETFVVLRKFIGIGGDDKFAKDAEHVYFFGFLIDGADPSSFEVMEKVESCGKRCVFQAKDKLHKFYQDRIEQ